MKKRIVASLLCLFLIAGSGTSRAAERRQFALVLDFSTCAVDPSDANVIVCNEALANGQNVGTIKVTFENGIASNSTSASWHERWDYTLPGGTVTVATSTDWQATGLAPDEQNFAPTVGFGKGEVTQGTGAYARVNGTVTMRWDDLLCICLFDLQ